MLETQQILHSEWERVNWELKEARDRLERAVQDKIPLHREILELKEKLAKATMTEEKELLYRRRISELETDVVELREKLADVTEVLKGVGPDAPTVVNDKGGKQSATPARLDLLPPLATLRVGKVLKDGAEKYGENNWRDIEVVDHLNHALVHLFAYLAGDDSDDHLSHAATRALFALELDLRDERAWAEEDEYKGGGNAD